MAGSQSEARVRLAPADRRRQLLRVASDLIATDGIENVRIPYIASAAGVTRPVVYKFFPNRQALIKSVLEDFRRELESRLPREVDLSADLDVLVRVFVNAACDTIEARGAGGWLLFASVSPDQEIAEVSREMRDRFLEPWLQGIASITNTSDPEGKALAEMLVAAGGAVIQVWIDEELTRADVVQLLTRSILAILNEFAA